MEELMIDSKCNGIIDLKMNGETKKEKSFVFGEAFDDRDDFLNIIVTKEKPKKKKKQISKSASDLQDNKIHKKKKENNKILKKSSSFNNPSEELIDKPKTKNTDGKKAKNDKPKIAKLKKERTPKTMLCSELSNSIRNPLLLVIDIRPGGSISMPVPNSYHERHIRLSINFPLEEYANDEELFEKVNYDPFIKPILLYAIQFQCKVVIYDQDCPIEKENSQLNRIYTFLLSIRYVEGKFSHRNLYLLLGGFSEFEKSYPHLCGNTKFLRTPLSNDYTDENIIDQIYPRIYLGRQLDPIEYDLLRELGINNILSVSQAPSDYPEEMNYKFLQIEDNLEASLDDVIINSCTFIDKALNTGTGSVYVHCSRGLSRSPTIIMAYLMRNYGLSLKDSYELVKKVRQNIGPQCNFIRQLLLLEKEIQTKVPDQDAQDVLRANRVDLKYDDITYTPSLPLQIYALHESRCEDYYRSVAFLFGVEDTSDQKKKEHTEFWEKLSAKFLKKKKKEASV